MEKKIGARIPKVAVITRTKDRGVLLERAIKSVHQQTMRDLIHVIINDGGDKKTVDDIVAKYKPIVDGRIRVIHNDSSIGMEAASNKAIKSVDSVFVAIHDDDDSWHPDFLGKTTQHLEETGQTGVIVTTDKVDEEIIGGAIQELGRDRWMPHIRTLNFYTLTRQNFAVPISFIYRRAVFKEIGFYDESLPVCGDWDFALRFMSLYDIEFLQTTRALAYYHHRPKAKGILGNSIFAGADTHEKYLNILQNRYLRNDIKSGSLGLGYLFNQGNVDIKANKMRDEEVKALYERIDQLEQIVIARTQYQERMKRLLKKLLPEPLYARLKGRK